MFSEIWSRKPRTAIPWASNGLKFKRLLAFWGEGCIPNCQIQLKVCSTDAPTAASLSPSFSPGGLKRSVTAELVKLLEAPEAKPVGQRDAMGDEAPGLGAQDPEAHVPSLESTSRGSNLREQPHIWRNSRGDLTRGTYPELLG